MSVVDRLCSRQRQLEGVLEASEQRERDVPDPRDECPVHLSDLGHRLCRFGGSVDAGWLRTNLSNKTALS
eukprot:466530-Prorocentrum_minimum.AAC.1